MRREKANAGYRHARLEEILFEELSTLLRDDISDPTLRDVRVISVSLSADYRHARVHVVVEEGSSGSDTGPRTIEEALGRASPFLRYRLAIDLDLKRTPELRFVCDAIVAHDPEGPP